MPKNVLLVYRNDGQIKPQGNITTVVRF